MGFSDGNRTVVFVDKTMGRMSCTGKGIVLCKTDFVIELHFNTVKKCHLGINCKLVTAPQGFVVLCVHIHNRDNKVHIFKSHTIAVNLLH